MDQVQAEALEQKHAHLEALIDQRADTFCLVTSEGDNPYSVAPWVISVAAGEKRGLGTPAGFSSRGNDNGTGSDTAGQPADPTVAPNLRPDITGSGSLQSSGGHQCSRLASDIRRGK